MHVSPSEIAGLNALGAMTGRQVTTNPHTGMPEAFSFGDFLSSLLPTAAGFLVGGPAGAGLGLEAGSTAATIAPIAAGMATGAAVAGAKGEDILTGGLMGGLGGYGGGGLGSAYGQTTAAMNAINPTAAGFTSTPGITSLTNPIKDIPGAMASDATSKTLGANLNNITSTLTNPLGTGATTGIDLTNMMGAGSNTNMLAGLGTQPGAAGVNLPAGALPNLGTQTPGFLDTYVDKLGGTNKALYKVGTPLAVSGLAGAAKDMFPEADKSEEEKRKAEQNKYRDTKTGLLNLTQARPDFGTAFMATGGTVGSNQSTISSGGIQDLYGTNDQTTGTQNLSKDGYGIGRLENLASEGSRAKAADTFYAMGGPIAFAKGGHQGYLDGQGDGMSDSIPATIEGQQPARLADGEFVIPADVVSHIGNGSSKAGSKQLYAMLDRIRKARTGHTKQGKEIKPQKYMPA
jgi:hypothetical protein